MDQTKFLRIVILLLLMINLSTLGFLFFHHPPHERPGGMHEVAEYLIHELNFTSSQIKSFDALKHEHHQKMMELKETNKLNHEKMFHLLSHEKMDSIQLKSSFDSISLNQLEIESVTFDHLRKIRALCSPEQQKKFDEIIEEAVKLMAPPPPPPGQERR